MNIPKKIAQMFHHKFKHIFKWKFSFNNNKVFNFATCKRNVNIISKIRIFRL